MPQNHCFKKSLLIPWYLILAACSPLAPAAPTLTPTPAAPETQITAANAHDLREVGKLGRGWIYAISASPDGRVLVVNTTIGVWVYRMADGEVPHYFEGEPLTDWYNVAGIAWSPDGSMLAVEQRRNGVKVWDTHTWELLAERDVDLPDPFQVIISYPGIAWSPDGKYLALGSGIEAVWVWDKELDTWENWSHFVGQQTAVTWNSAGQLLLLGTDEKDSGLFDVTTGKLVQPLDHGGGFCCQRVSWSPNGELVFLQNYRSDGSVFQAPTREDMFSVGENAATAWSPDGQYFASSHIDFEDGPVVQIFKTNSAEIIYEERLSTPYRALTWTAQGELLGAGVRNGEMHLWHIQTQGSVFPLNQHNIGGSVSVLWQHGGPKLVDFIPPNNILVWDVDQQAILLNVQHHAPIDKIKFSYSQGWIALVDGEGKMTIIDVVSGKALPSGDNARNTITAVFVDILANSAYEDSSTRSPDGSKIAVTYKHQNLQILNRSGKKAVIYLDVIGHYPKIAWSPQGDLLAVGLDSSKIYFFDANNGELSAELLEARGDINLLAWSTDGARLYALSSDGTLRVWAIP
ncbi:MAG: WD40 repeat domain-containing protein [Anaerolineae bacterium]|nr:WD40 repeat domain-containing protein [Anaerolineae bacterium]